jgi:hypothetical protein
MKPSRVFFLPLLILCLGASGTPSPASPAGPQAEPLPITLEFAWPAHAIVQITQTRWLEKEGHPSEKTTTLYQVEITRDDDGYTVHWDTNIFDNVPRGLLPADYRISAQGLFLGLADPDSYVLDVSRKVPELSQLGAIPEARERYLKSVQEAARSDWALLASAWIGRAMTPGQVSLENSEHPYDGVVNTPELSVSVEQQRRLQLRQRLACEAGQNDQRCVELVLDSICASKSALAEKVAEQMKLGHSEERIILVTEPSTLLPHRIVRRQMDAADGSVHLDSPGSTPIVVSDEVWKYAAEPAQRR